MFHYSIFLIAINFVHSLHVKTQDSQSSPNLYSYLHFILELFCFIKIRQYLQFLQFLWKQMIQPPWFTMSCGEYHFLRVTYSSTYSISIQIMWCWNTIRKVLTKLDQTQYSQRLYLQSSQLSSNNIDCFWHQITLNILFLIV